MDVRRASIRVWESLDLSLELRIALERHMQRVGLLLDNLGFASIVVVLLSDLAPQHNVPVLFYDLIQLGLLRLPSTRYSLLEPQLIPGFRVSRPQSHLYLVLLTYFAFIYRQIALMAPTRTPPRAFN